MMIELSQQVAGKSDGSGLVCRSLVVVSQPDIDMRGLRTSEATVFLSNKSHLTDLTRSGQICHRPPPAQFPPGWNGLTDLLASFSISTQRPQESKRRSIDEHCVLYGTTAARRALQSPSSFSKQPRLVTAALSGQARSDRRKSRAGHSYSRKKQQS